MTDQTRKEVIKSIVYGKTAEEIAEIYGISVDEVGKIMQDNADDINAEREYRAMLEGKTC
jgi:DNA-directed RNA polymerase specialized sigma24 family protein